MEWYELTGSDAINGWFELFASGFIILSVLKVWGTRSSAGVNWVHPAFFSAWGFWNLYYYPHLDQWLSFVGGIGVVICNTIWVALLFKYRRK